MSKTNDGYPDEEFTAAGIEEMFGERPDSKVKSFLRDLEGIGWEEWYWGLSPHSRRQFIRGATDTDTYAQWFMQRTIIELEAELGESLRQGRDNESLKERMLVSEMSSHDHGNCELCDQLEAKLQTVVSDRMKIWDRLRKAEEKLEASDEK